VRGRGSRGSAAAAESVATVENVGGEFSLQKTILGIEQRLDAAASDHNDDDDDEDDVLPAVATEMGVGQYQHSNVIVVRFI